MVFSSLPFVLGFLPIFFLCYYAVSNGAKNFVLLLGSVVFYAVGTLKHPEHMALLLAAIVVDFYAAKCMERFPKMRTPVFVVSILYHLVWLLYYKLAVILLTPADFVLPAGISFYTFQGISYLADVYRKKYPAEPLIPNLACYIIMFPQLIAGPMRPLIAAVLPATRRSILWTVMTVSSIPPVCMSRPRRNWCCARNGFSISGTR